MKQNTSNVLTLWSKDNVSWIVADVDEFSDRFVKADERNVSFAGQSRDELRYGLTRAVQMGCNILLKEAHIFFTRLLANTT